MSPARSFLPVRAAPHTPASQRDPRGAAAVDQRQASRRSERRRRQWKPQQDSVRIGQCGRSGTQAGGSVGLIPRAAADRHRVPRHCCQRGALSRPADGSKAVKVFGSRLSALGSRLSALGRYDSASKNAVTDGIARGGSERASGAPGFGARMAEKNSIAASTLRCRTSSSGSMDQLPGSCRLPTMMPSACELIVFSQSSP